MRTESDCCCRPLLVEVKDFVTRGARWHLQQDVGAIDGFKVATLRKLRFMACDLIFQITYHGSGYVFGIRVHTEAGALGLCCNALAA